MIKSKLFFLYLAECSSALGLEDLTIEDSQLTAQSYYESLSIGGGISVDTEPKCARLNKNNCAWCAAHGKGQYLQVDLRHDLVITGIATQGLEALSDYYVRRYKVSHSRNGHTWSTFPVSINLKGTPCMSISAVRDFEHTWSTFPVSINLAFCEINGNSNTYSDINNNYSNMNCPHKNKVYNLDDNR